jgi:hypothetical protein
MQINILNKSFVCFIILLIFCSIISISVFSQQAEIAIHEDSVQKDSIQVDKTILNVEKVPWKKIEEYRKNKAFDYNIKLKSGLNLFPRFSKWLAQLLEGAGKHSIPFKVIWWIFVIAVVGFIIYKIIGADLSGLFRRNKKIKTADGFEYFDEDIHSQDLDRNLNKALAEQDFRKAIRFYYLKLLKQLDLSELIHWKISKTNLDYYNELKGKAILNDFKVLSGIYEYTWYGNFAVNQSHFSLWQTEFQSAIKQAAQN